MDPTAVQDTDHEAERIRIGILRAMSPAQKLARIGSACALARALVMSDLRARHPGAGPGELRRMLLERYLGADHPATRRAAAEA